MKLGRCLLASDREQPARGFAHAVLGFREGIMSRIDGPERRPGDVIAEGIRDHKIAVAEPLHECAGPEPVGAVIGEVGLPQDEEPGDRTHQLIIHPEPTH